MSTIYRQLGLLSKHQGNLLSQSGPTGIYYVIGIYSVNRIYSGVLIYYEHWVYNEIEIGIYYEKQVFFQWEDNVRKKVFTKFDKGSLFDIVREIWGLQIINLSQKLRAEGVAAIAVDPRLKHPWKVAEYHGSFIIWFYVCPHYKTLPDCQLPWRKEILANLANGLKNHPNSPKFLPAKINILVDSPKLILAKFDFILHSPKLILTKFNFISWKERKNRIW